MTDIIDRGFYSEAIPSETRAAPAPMPVTLVGVQGRPAAPATDPATLMRTVSTNELTWACVEVKRKAMQDPRLIVQKVNSDGTYEEDRGHPLRRLMMRPHPDLDEAAFMGLAVASLDIAGVFYAEKVRSASGTLVQLNPLNPANMRKRLDAGKHTGWIWSSGTNRVEFELDEVLVCRHPSWGTIAPLAVAMGAVDADTAQTDFIRGFFNGGGQPSGVLSTEQELKQEQADVIRARWRAQHGRYGQRDIAVLGRGTTYHKTGAGLDEIDNESVRGFTESRICMVFNVPPLIVYAHIGLMQATYSNMKQAWASFYDTEISAQLKHWRSFFTWSLLTEYESEQLIYAERVRLAWDLSQVAALQDDVDAVHARSEKIFRAGGMLLNEYRAAVGLPADKNGDYYLRPLAVQAVPSDQAVLQLDESSAAVRSRVLPLAFKAMSLNTIETRMQAAVQTYLLQQHEKVAQVVEHE